MLLCSQLKMFFTTFFYLIHSLIISLFHDQRYGTCNILYTDSQFCYPNKKLAIYIFLSFFLVSCYSKTIPLHPRLTLLAWNSVKYISSSKFSDIDECYSAYNPCRNGGTCVNSVGGYSCHCKAGYSGINCEIGEKRYSLI